MSREPKRRQRVPDIAAALGSSVAALKRLVAAAERPRLDQRGLSMLAGQIKLITLLAQLR